MNHAQVAAVLLILSVVATPALGQSSWCQYQRGTLRSTMDAHREALAKDLPAGHRNDIVSMDSRPTRTSVIYLGDSRSLSGPDSAFLDAYFYRAIRDTAFRRLFSRQVRVVEGTDTLWLAIQETLMPDLESEVRLGERVTLFVRWQGVAQSGPSTRWQFTVNEFAATKSQPAWARVFAECGQQW